jgi:alpha-beta hydrolase superfamily lysophospholipase
VAPSTTVTPPPVTTVGPVQVPSSTAPPPAGPPYRVDEITVRLVDPSRPTVSLGRLLSTVRTLTTTVRLPAAPGRWPLIVFAHGFDVGPESYGALLDAWAAHGYVVAAPELPLTDPTVAGANLDENDINSQPADLRFVTDALTAAASPVSARIDPARVAVAGHSDGAESALAASLLPPPAGEPRYRALIAMSVQPLPGSGATANPPVLVTQGDADTINPPSYGLQTWQQAAAPKYLLVLRGGGHLPPLQAGSAWLPGVEAVTEAFLDAYVAGDAPPSAVATAASVTAAGLLSLQSG